jgi:hypothetical protein
MENQKVYKGEKYIYLLMAYKMAKQNNGSVRIGNDNGFTGGQNYYRRFAIQEYKGKTLLTECKTSKSFADFSRCFEIVLGDTEMPIIKDYITDEGDNAGQNWYH